MKIFIITFIVGTLMTSCSIKNHVTDGVYIKRGQSKTLLLLRDTNFIYISKWGNYTTLGRGVYTRSRKHLYLHFEKVSYNKMKSICYYSDGLVDGENRTVHVRDLGMKYDTLPRYQRELFDDAINFIKSDSVYSKSYKW